MSRFLTPLDQRPRQGLDAAHAAALPSDAAGREIGVPVGFPTDFASVPRLPVIF